jgi:hypothetical protein
MIIGPESVESQMEAAVDVRRVELRRLHIQLQWKEHPVSYFKCMMVRIL